MAQALGSQLHSEMVVALRWETDAVLLWGPWSHSLVEALGSRLYSKKVVALQWGRQKHLVLSYHSMADHYLRTNHRSSNYRRTNHRRTNHRRSTTNHHHRREALGSQLHSEMAVAMAG
jgi:hypothetical protein